LNDKDPFLGEHHELDWHCKLHFDSEAGFVFRVKDTATHPGSFFWRPGLITFNFWLLSELINCMRYFEL
jgi:hypothetical protein